MTATDATPTARERLTAVLRGCDAPASTAYLAAALGAAGRMRRLTVWKTLRRMEDLGEVARVTAAGGRAGGGPADAVAGVTRKSDPRWEA